MYITIVSISYPPSIWNSIGRTTYSIAHGLASLGHKVSVVTYNPAIGDKFSRDNKVCIQYIGTDGKLNLAIDQISTWQNLVKEFLATYGKSTQKFICIDSYSYKAIVDSGIKVPVLGLCNFLYSSTGWLQNIGAHYEQVLLEQEKDFIIGCNKLLCNNLVTQEKIANLYNICADIFTIGIPEIKGIVRSSKKNQVLFVGKLNREKGIERVLRVMPKLPWLNLLLCDQNKNNVYTGTIAKLANNLGIQNRISYTGFLSTQDVWKLYAESEICVVPHIAEPFGYAAIYPMMLGTPTITSIANGLPEIVGVDGDCGAVFRNLEDLAFYLNEIHHTKPLQDMYSENGKARILEQRLLSSMIDSIVCHI